MIPMASQATVAHRRVFKESLLGGDCTDDVTRDVSVTFKRL